MEINHDTISQENALKGCKLCAGALLTKQFKLDDVIRRRLEEIVEKDPIKQ